MINLLSTTKKAEIRAARTNTILLRYVIVLLLSLLFISGIIYISYDSLRTSEKSALAQLSETTSHTEDISTTLNEIKRHSINNSMSIPQALEKIAKTLPAGSIVRSLAIEDRHLRGEPLSITVYAKQGVADESIKQALESSGALSQLAITSSRGNNREVPDYTVKIELTGILNSATAVNAADNAGIPRGSQ